MKIESTSVADYFSKIPEDRFEAMTNLREIINNNLTSDIEECINYNMLSWVIPHNVYPDGYHCNPELRLPFISIASQKNFIALYHVRMYADKKVQDWFVSEYPKYTKRKLDMGKSCIRFKNIDDIPFDLIEQLIQRISIKDWIESYERTLKK